ncbi:MAG: zinc ribbon domain-containing protein [Nitrosopumilus sp.]|nr:zinc ribbon domain-containing protein [Nitrosopumilus sp.]
MVEINKPCPKCNEPTTLEQEFCNKCGNSLESEKSKQHCSSCGNLIQYPEKFCNKCGNKAELSTFQYNENKQSPTLWWYAFPIIFAIFGGVTAWALLRESNYRMATNCLITGIGITAIYVVIVIINSEFQ